MDNDDGESLPEDPHVIKADMKPTEGATAAVTDSLATKLEKKRTRMRAARALKANSEQSVPETSKAQEEKGQENKTKTVRFEPAGTAIDTNQARFLLSLQLGLRFSHALSAL